ncbi:MAG: alpha-L-fucosidase [Kiritimatiellia bacterium]
MSTLTVITIFLLLAVSSASSHEASLKKESIEKYNKRMQWFAQAQFGMFIHFGLYSQAGGIWEGQKVKGYTEWIQSKHKIKKEEYAQLLKTFNPSRFDADFIVSMAKQAGMKYLIITSKHHEGFCLWNSRYTEYDVASTPFKGRDILGELNNACKKHGLKFGLYYSIIDWHHPAQSGLDFHNQMVKGRKQEYLDYQNNQIRELIKRYDPAILWFDGDWAKWWTIQNGIDLYNTIRNASSEIIVNNRVAKRKIFELDYVTQEQNHFKNSFSKHWEACYTMNKSWGYSKHDSNWKTPETIYNKLKDINHKGGNLLLNVGPDGNGDIPPEAIAILKDSAKLLQAKPISKNIPKITEVPGIRQTL